ncbi:MAG: sodium:alanine symporter family protein [Candidatus Anaerobiospirillum merdipullorum]|uniref:Sodium:alanine symporter family protein n=1 Tax=Candidatus Anaerobiospirillum merdipullorum TaxID=2838450 RepID=A0A9E2NU90_9GAMM|nr:sodium:alanine symporter family protein [Candidatus Anaerobiospirillum merdipullorum]
MDQLTLIVRDINSILWGPWCLIPILVGTGIFFTFKLRFIQIRQFGRAFKHVFGAFSIHGAHAGKQGMSSFQSLATAVAAQVGTGNLAGVATAMAMGGPGAIFWMWCAAFFGMATICAEAILAQIYRTRDGSGHITGGPAYYISAGLGSKPLAMIFSFLIIIALGFIGNMVQANSISTAFESSFNIPTWVSGLFIIMIAGFIFIGGVKRLASFAEKMVPLMASVYVLGSLYIVITCIDMLLPSLEQIIVGAFNPSAATGGVIGASVKEAIRYGVARGLFSNEAGMGSTPHAHAIARVRHPAEQGLASFIGLFIDTFVVLNATAIVILVTGSLDGQATGIVLTQNAFIKGMGEAGAGFVSICLFFAAFTTIIGWYFFAEQNVKYLFGTKVVNGFSVIVLCFLMLGSFLKVDLVWELADMFNGLMVIPNIIAVVGLYRLVARAVDDYENKFLQGKRPVFGPSDKLTGRFAKIQGKYRKLKKGKRDESSDVSA